MGTEQLATRSAAVHIRHLHGSVQDDQNERPVRHTWRILEYNAQIGLTSRHDDASDAAVVEEPFEYALDASAVHRDVVGGEKLPHNVLIIAY